MHRRIVAAVCAVLACLFAVSLSGCGKSKQPPAKTSAQMPQVGKESAAGDTGDIFKEFYSEDSTAKKQGKAGAKKSGKQQTFSTDASQKKSSASSFSGEFSANGRYTVQVSCVKSQSFANSMVSKLKDKGFPAYVAEVQNPTPNLSGTFYRVRIGGFNGLSEAKSFGQNTLVADGYEFWVDKKSNDNVGMEGYGLGSGSAGSSAAGSYQSAPTPSTYQSSTPSSSGSYSTTPSPSTDVSGSSTSSGAAATPSSQSSTAPAATTPSSSTTASSPAPASGTQSATTGSSAPASSSQTTATTSSPSGSVGSSSAASSPAGTGSTGAASGSSATSNSTGTSASTGTSGSTGTSSTGSSSGSTGSGWGKDSTSGGW
jgi:SPOR domain